MAPCGTRVGVEPDGCRPGVMTDILKRKGAFVNRGIRYSPAACPSRARGVSESPGKAPFSIARATDPNMLVFIPGTAANERGRKKIFKPPFRKTRRGSWARPHYEQACREAADNCPTEAIAVY
jgi:hypothetical protein